MVATAFFTDEQKEHIREAIVDAERKTSGEIKVHIDRACPGNVLDRAAQLFTRLGMDKTKQRNGVLIYLAYQDRKFAILGDAGINAVVPGNFWDDIKIEMQQHFRSGHFAEGLIGGVSHVGQRLKAHFPYQTDDENELSDELSFGQD